LGALLLAVAGCGTALAPVGVGEAPMPNESLAGVWAVAFRLDSVRAPGGAPSRWQSGSFREVQGRLRLTDSTAGAGSVVRSSMDVDFTPLLGRQMSCFDTRPSTTGVERHGDTVRLWFTPGVADCGFGASGILRGDSLIGSWEETSFAGPVTMGRLLMKRSDR
jgi:hypothetical protein